jgi:CheY-like chemotaxis protein
MSETEPRLLMLIDDEPAQSRLIAALAAREGWRTLVVHDAETAIATLGTRQGMQLGAIILDQWVPGDDACELIAELRNRRPALPILMLTTSASPLLAVEAMRAGATDYLIKPVAPDRMMQALRAATTRETPRDELQPLTEKMHGPATFEAMIGAAPAFRTALAIAAKAARGHGPVLVEGKAAPARKCWSAQSTPPASGPRCRCASSTPDRRRAIPSNPCCSAMRKAPSPAHSTARSARSSIATAPLWSSTRSTACPWRFRNGWPKRWPEAIAAPSARAIPSAWTCA